MHLMLNPDVTTREMGVMEKCTFCIQRIRDVKDAWRDVKETVPDAALVRLTACAAACPTNAITFGNAKDAEGAVAKKFENPRSYTLLGELNTKPGIRYMARVRFTEGAATAGHGGGAEHGGGEHGGETKPAHAEG
jgi:molybdopterin-containing oxidoreductase family iron-sulfur binding subunit